MAKFGEGDQRWIVQDRADGTNVHNWHWSERDCMGYSRSLLSSLLSNLQILDGEGGISITTKTLDKVEGEAYVNVRKGKVIPGYELSLNLSWEGEAKDVSVKVTGSIDVPYLADENADEDPEVKVSVRDDDGPVGRRIKDALLTKGKPIILEKIRIYVDAMSKGGPARDELEAKNPAPAASKAAPSPAAAMKPSPTETTEKEKEKRNEEKKKKNKNKEGFKNITMSEKFYCRSKDLYEILMDENRWKGFTQSNARISKEVGGQFSLFDGSISGVNEELQEGKLIVQKWRFASWPEGLYSMVRLVFDEPEAGLTVVNLTQTDVPEEDKYGNATVVENTERGWRELIFHKIRAVFGFGI